MHSQCLSFIYSGQAHEGKAKLRTGLGKSDRPGSQGAYGNVGYGGTRNPPHNRKGACRKLFT